MPRLFPTIRVLQTELVALAARQRTDDLSCFRDKPAAYIKEKLNVELWSTQQQICDLLLKPPYRVLCKACHKVGKSFLAACLISWFYDCFNPSLCITTAPSEVAVRDQLWRQVRLVRSVLPGGLADFRGTHAPELWSGEDHWAKGLTAAKSEAFHGRHAEHMLFVIDEGVGVEAWVYQVMRSMFKPDGKHHWLTIGNPTDTSSPMYSEELSTDLDGNPSWHLVQMSALDHPNLTGTGPQCPAAVSREQFEDWLADWADAIPAEEATALDVQYPPARPCPCRERSDAQDLPADVGEGGAPVCADGPVPGGSFPQVDANHGNSGGHGAGPGDGPRPGAAEILVHDRPGCVLCDGRGVVGGGRWYRPGPQFEARALGRWPSEGTYGVWSDALWQAALRAMQLPHVDVLPEIGCDVARYGDDYTELHVRCGGVSLHHERHNGWSTDRTAARLRDLADEYARWHNARLDPARQPVEPQEIRVKVDDGGVGGGVTDQSFGYNFIPVLSQATPCDPERYESTRSELWFNTAERARRGGLDLSRLHRADLARLRQQAMGPIWEMDAQGRRKVEKKKDTKKRLGTGSPDGMDAMNLAYYAGSFFEPPTVIS